MTKKKAIELTPYQKSARAKVQKFKRAFDLATTNKNERVHAGSTKSRGKKIQEIEKMPSQQQIVNQEVERDNLRKVRDLPEMEREQLGLNEPEIDWEEDDFEGEGDTSEGLNHPKKKKHRGPTKLNFLKTIPRGQKLSVGFNIKGQPIGPNSEFFSSYLGKLARNRVPISIRTWHKVPESKGSFRGIKDKMWDCIKQRFVVPEYAKKQTVKMIGKDWREYKTKLRSAFYDAYDNDEDRVAHCPPDVMLVDWRAFVAYTSTDEYKKLREIGKKATANHKMPHTTSRKGFGRLEDEIIKSDGAVPVTRSTVWVIGHRRKNGEPVNELAKGKIDQLNEMSPSMDCGKDDALSQVLGPDPNGRLRGVGYGVTASTLYATQQYSGRMCELEHQYFDVLKELSAVKETLAKVLNNQESDQSSFQPCLDLPKKHQLSLDGRACPMRTPLVAQHEHRSLSAQSNQNLQTPPTAQHEHRSLSAQSNQNLQTPPTAQCDYRSLSAQSNQNLQTPPTAQCDYQSLSAQSNQNLQTPPTAQRDHRSLSAQSKQNMNSVGGTQSKVVKCKLFRLVPDDVVAEGSWYTDNPTVKVHHVLLGPDFSKVSIDVAIQKDALPVRGNTELKTIEDAVSCFVAWPTSSILKL